MILVKSPPVISRKIARAFLPFFLLPGLLLAAPHSGWAQAEPAGEEDLLGGFDETPPGEEAANADEGFDDPSLEKAPPSEAAFYDLGGFIRLDSAYNHAHEAPLPGQTDWRGLSKFRLALQLELALELGEKWDAFISGQTFYDAVYGLKGRENYSDAVLDTNEKEGEFREVFVRGTPFSSMDIKLGRQIVVWGKSDIIRVVDVLNPLDNREPGLTDLEDLRLPLTMSRLDFFAGDWGLTAVAVHEIRFDKNPAPGSDFIPPAFAMLPPEEVPDDGGQNTEYGVAINGIFSGWDIGFYWAQFYNDAWRMTLDTSSFPPTPDGLVHDRLTMGGVAFSAAMGDYLLRGETARFSGLRFDSVPGKTFDRLDSLVGLEYTGFTDTTLSAEALQRHIQDYDPALQNAPDEQGEDLSQYGLSYRGTFLREKLSLAAVIIAFGGQGEKGNLQRYSATYALADGLNLTGGAVAYSPGDGSNFLMNTAQDNDRVFADVKWSF